MKKAIFILTSFLISVQIFARQIPANDTCIPVPYVNFEVSFEWNSMLVTWEKTCDTCQVLKYELAWVDAFDYCNGETPEYGTLHHRGYTTDTAYNDTQWGPRPPGYYTYAIKAMYEYCESEWTYSNTIFKVSKDSFSVVISLEDGEIPVGVTVSADGFYSCIDSDTVFYSGESNTEGIVDFEQIENGIYNLVVSNPGYETAAFDSIPIYRDTILEVQLSLLPDGNSCTPVPGVSAELSEDQLGIYVNWDKPCDTCQVKYYQVAWVDGYDPCMGETPEDGTIHHRQFTNDLYYYDGGNWIKPPGYYAYAVKCLYDSCFSEWIYSDYIYIPPTNKLQVIVTLEDGISPMGSFVTAEGLVECNELKVYSDSLNYSGQVQFEDVHHGLYTLTVSNEGYETVKIENINIIKDTTISVELLMNDICQAVPWVTADLQGEYINVSWDIPCEGCDVTQYEIARLVDFDPCVGETPEDGTIEHKAYSNELSWASIYGWPRYNVYAIKAFYDSCTSPWVYSNILFPEFDNYSLVVEVYEEGGGALEGAFITLMGNTICTEQLTYSEQSFSDGSTFFTDVQEGEYALTVNMPGYQLYHLDSVGIFTNSMLQVYLTLGTFPPADQLTVDENTGTAEWNYFGNKNQLVELQGFKIYLDDSLVAETANDEFSYQFLGLVHNTSYKASVSAKYETGESEWVSTTFTTNFLEVDELFKTIGVKIFPNPAEDVVYLQAEQEILKAEIMNSMGQVLIQKEVKTKNLQLETNDLESGVYFVRMQFESGTLSRPLVIQKQ